ALASGLGSVAQVLELRIPGERERQRFLLEDLQIDRIDLLSPDGQQDRHGFLEPCTGLVESDFPAIAIVDRDAREGDDLPVEDRDRIGKGSLPGDLPALL